jgi:hypothetical protein
MSSVRRILSLLTLLTLSTGCASLAHQGPSSYKLAAGGVWQLGAAERSVFSVRVTNIGAIPVGMAFDSGGVKRWFRTLTPGTTFESVMAHRQVLLLTNSSMQSAQLQVWTSADDRRDVPYAWLFRH